DLTTGIMRQADGSFIANARASLEDVTAVVGAEFDVSKVAQDVDTLGGYIATRIGRVPVRGELVPGPGRFEIEILEADPRRVKKLKIYRNTEPSSRQNSAGTKQALAMPSGKKGQQTEPAIPSSEASSIPVSDSPPQNPAYRP